MNGVQKDGGWTDGGTDSKRGGVDGGSLSLVAVF
jgi:hypothetical protein